MSTTFLSSTDKSRRKIHCMFFSSHFLLFISFCCFCSFILAACGDPSTSDQPATSLAGALPTPMVGKTATPPANKIATPVPGKTATSHSGETTTPASAPNGLLLTQENPVCERSSSAVWEGNAQSTAASSCDSGSLTLAPVSQSRLAEIDLARINGKDYSSELNNFEASIDVTQPIAVTIGLQSSQDDNWVGFNVQTPTPGSGCGGIIFVASPLGYWKLEQVDSCSHIAVLQNGTFTPPAPYYQGDSPFVKMHLTVRVQQGRLTGWVGNQKLTSVSNSFVSSVEKPSVVGLVAEYRTNAFFSPTKFTNFWLVTGKCREDPTRCTR